MTINLTSFSYLAAVTTLHVERMPPEDYGEAVTSVDRFVAADGPIAAGVASALGRAVSLATNPVAADDMGTLVLGLLRRWGIPARSGETDAAISPSSTVIASASGSRTFFPHLPGVLAALAQCPLDDLLAADWAYVDCYQVLGPVTERPVRERLRAGGPLLVNLGGSPLPDWLSRDSVEGKVDIVQTNAPDGDVDAALAIHDRLAAQEVARCLVISLGSGGAIASDTGGIWRISAASVDATRMQGAGAALSAGLIHRLLEGDGLPEAVRFGCAVGTAWCTAHTDPPTADMIDGVYDGTLVSLRST